MPKKNSFNLLRAKLQNPNHKTFNHTTRHQYSHDDPALFNPQKHQYSQHPAKCKLKSKTLMIRCFPTTASASSSAAGEITSTYATPLGAISLTWIRASLGVLLLADLRLTSDGETDHLRLRLRPHLKWKRKGSKRHRFTSASGRRRVVDLAWDLSVATFSGGRPEPAGGFFVSVAVDGKMALLVGDREEEEAGRVMWRRERVRFGGMGGEIWYATKGRFEVEMEISIWVDLEGEEMRIGVDGEEVVEVRRLGWKFRGREGAELRKGGED